MRAEGRKSLRRLTLKRHAGIIAYALALVLISRILLYMVGFLGVNLFPQYTMKPAYEAVIQPFGQTHDVMKLPERLSETKVLRLPDFFKFDSYFYLQIAEEGYDRYQLAETHPPANWVFFPLYPLLVSTIADWTPWWTTATVGMVLSNALLVAALYFLQLTALQRGLAEGQARSLLFTLLIYPASIYFSLMYTESLFLCLSAATIYFSVTKRYGLALFAAGLSTVTRVPGVANLLFAAGSLLLDKGFKYTWRDLRYVLYGLLSLAPLGAYFLYMKQLTGSYLAPIHEQANWGREQAAPFQSYLHYLKQPYFILEGGWDNGFISFAIATAVLLVFVIYALLHARSLIRSPAELLFFLYGTALLVIPFSSSPAFLTSIVRYLMVSIPFYFYLQDLMRRHILVRQLAIGFLLTLQVVITLCFVNDYFFVV